MNDEIKKNNRFQTLAKIMRFLDLNHIQNGDFNHWN
jgi:hypothetical protein